MGIANVPKELADFYQLTQTRAARLWEKGGRRCHWCGKATIITRHDIPNRATEDHVVPRGLGGSDEESNVVSACLNCNARRAKEQSMHLREGALMSNWNSRKYPQVSTRDVENDRLQFELNIARSRYENAMQQMRFYKERYEEVSSRSLWWIARLRISAKVRAWLSAIP